MSVIPTLSEYSIWNARIRCCFHWTLIHSYVPQKSSLAVLAEAHNIFDDDRVKDVIAEEFTKGEIYIDLFKNIFEVKKDVENLEELFEVIFQMGFDDVSVSHHSLTHRPIYVESHVEFIEMLMKASTEYHSALPLIHSAINYITLNSAGDLNDLQLEEGLIRWINEVLSKLREITLLMDSDKNLSYIPDIKTLEDLGDGAALALLMHYYCPDNVALEDIALRDPISLADSWHNIEILLDFFNNQLVPLQQKGPICPALPPSVVQREDLLYFDVELRWPMIIFLVQIFTELELKPGELVRPKGHEMVLNGSVNKKMQGSRNRVTTPQKSATENHNSDRKHLPDVSQMISSATKRSFLKQQRDMMSSSTRSTPDIFHASSLSMTSRPLLSRRHLSRNHGNRPYTTEEITQSHQQQSEPARPHTVLATTRSHPLRKSTSLQDISDGTLSVASTKNQDTAHLTPRARWKIKREQIASVKKQHSRDSMGEAQSTATSATVGASQTNCSTNTLLSNVAIDSDDDQATYRVKTATPLSSTTTLINEHSNDQTLSSELHASIPHVGRVGQSPDKSKILTASKTSSQSSYTVTNGGFNTAESALAAGYPVINNDYRSADEIITTASVSTGSNNSTPRQESPRKSTVLGKKSISPRQLQTLQHSDNTAMTLPKRDVTWTQISTEQNTYKEKHSRVVKMTECERKIKSQKLRQVSAQLEKRRMDIKKEMKEKEKEWAKKLLKIRMEMYTYAMEMQELEDNENLVSTATHAQAMTAWGEHRSTSPKHTARTFVSEETQTSQIDPIRMHSNKNLVEDAPGQNYFNSPLSETILPKTGYHRNIPNTAPPKLNHTMETGLNQSEPVASSTHREPLQNDQNNATYVKKSTSPTIWKNPNHSGYQGDNKPFQNPHNIQTEAEVGDINHDQFGLGKTSVNPQNDMTHNVPVQVVKSSPNQDKIFEEVASSLRPLVEHHGGMPQGSKARPSENNSTRRSLFAKNEDNSVDEISLLNNRKPQNENSTWNEVTMTYDSFCKFNATSNHSTPSKNLIDQQLSDNNNMNNNATPVNDANKENIATNELESTLLTTAEVDNKGGQGFEIISEGSPADKLARKKEAFLLKQLRKEEEQKKKKVEREAEMERRKEEQRVKQEAALAKKEEERMKRQQRLEEYKKRKEREEAAAENMMKPGIVSSGKKKHSDGSRSQRENIHSSPVMVNGMFSKHKTDVLSPTPDQNLMLSSGDYISNRLKFSPQRMAKSHNQINEIGREWDVDSNASSALSLEYHGPKLYKQLSTKSNRNLIMNAICHSCLPAKVNEVTRNKAVEALENSDARHIMILFRDSKCQYRAIYGYDPEAEKLHKINGNGPAHISPNMIEALYKYNSGRKGFTVVHSKTLSVGIDAITIKSSYWLSAKKPAFAGHPLSARKKK